MKKFNFALNPLVASLLLVSACGPQAFVPGTNHLTQSGGGMDLPPKVDILFGFDDKGAMGTIYPGFNTEINNFTANLQSSGWDYRFTSISLAEDKPGATYPFSKIAVAKYDGNWFATNQWLSPYPGAVPSAQQILANYFSTQTTAASFFPASVWNNPDNGHKTGIQNEVDFLNRADVQSDFLRTDALLAVITLSPSRDTSGGQWVLRPQDGQYIWTAPTPDNIDTTYVPSMLALKGSPSLVKYYALVSHYANSNQSCRGANTFAGTRYEKMATQLGGTSIDICTNTLPSALSQVQQNLNTVRLSYHRIYVLLASEPNVATISVKKNGVDVPQDATNGWTYAGYTTQYTIDLPILMNQATGYMIKLNGTAGVTGTDEITVDYINAGAVSSH